MPTTILGPNRPTIIIDDERQMMLDAFNSYELKIIEDTNSNTYSTQMYILDGRTVFFNFVIGHKPRHSNIILMFTAKCNKDRCQQLTHTHVPLNCPLAICTYCQSTGHNNHNCARLFRDIK